jgi:hypothetical protein
MTAALLGLSLLLAGWSSLPAPDSLPPVGIAVRDTAGGWCASIAAGGLAQGASVTLVFADPTAPEVARGARITRRRDRPCPAEFAQGSLEALPAYDVAPDQLDGEGAPWVALIVASDAPWGRGPRGEARADLDGDGALEEARVCAADEGEHFTVWTLDPAAAPRRRWHGYYDWGAMVDPTCRPGEDGR